MYGPVARARALAAAGVLLTAVVGSAVLAAGSSADAAGTVARGAAAPRIGPVVPPPAARPLVRVDGPLLPAAPAPRLRATPPRMGPPRASAAATAGPRGVVGPGSPVAQVRAVQRLLKARGADLRVDGAWGPATTRAVRAVQAAAGLPVDGRVGPLTAAALRR